MVICIETATNLCSVALCSNSGVISLKENTDLKSHASMLTVFIDEALNETGIRAGDLEAVAVGKGPGSVHWSENWRFRGKRDCICSIYTTYRC